MKAKKLIEFILLIILCTIITLNCPQDVHAKKKNPDVYMVTGNTMKIPVSFHGGYYYYKSTNLNVLQFTAEGKMIAVKRGNATVILTYFDKDNKPVRTSFKVKIHDKVKKLKWKKKTDRMNVGEQYDLSVKYKVKSRKNVVLVWESSDPDIATVDEKGKVIAVSGGTARISCYVKGQKKTKLSTVISIDDIPVEEVSVKRETIKLKVGSYYNIIDDVTIYPDNATNKILETTSSKPGVASVSNGIIYGVKKGKAKITIEAADHYEKKAVVEVLVDDWLEKDSVKWVAHRGLSSEAPDNTIKAFELAADKGFDMVETDIYMTKDKKFVVSHDANIIKMCGVDVRIQDVTYDELRKYPIIRGNNYELYDGDEKVKNIPTLDEYLRTCISKGIVPMIEIKFIDGDETFDEENALYMLYRQVKTLMGDRPYCYISFHENTITSMNEIIRKSYDKNIALYLLVNGNVNVDSISIYDYCVKNNIGFSVCHTGNELLITRMKADGCKVGVWTVNDCQTAGKCVDLGVDFVVTDKVLWLD